jgi:Domain of unknown function (DUF4214)
MTSPMQLFIAEALRKITEELSAVPLRDERLTGAAADQFLDTSMAEALSGGSFLFPGTEDDTEPDWCVLTLSGSDAAHRPETFRLRGRLRADLDPEEFVARAYELILMREIDETGRGIYPDLIGRYVLTKRDVLKILAESPEAQSRNVKYIVVPDPSSWLSQLGVIPGDDASFPPVAVTARA